MKLKKLKTDARGYVAHVRCEQYHSGNTRFVQDGNWCQCQGCGNFVSTETLRAEQSRELARKTNLATGRN